MRILLDENPFARPDPAEAWGYAPWPARWIRPLQAKPPFVAAYRLVFELAAETTVRLHVSADERYELFLDGELLGRGPERGCPERWYFETFDLTLPPGAHVLAARAWALGRENGLSPSAQMSVEPGFILAGEGDAVELLSTGRAPWEVKLLGGYTFTSSYATGIGSPFVGSVEMLDAATYDFAFAAPGGDGWQTPAVGKPGRSAGLEYGEAAGRHRLTPAELPPTLARPVTLHRLRFASYLPEATALEAGELNRLPPVRLADTDEALAGLLAPLALGDAVELPAGATFRAIFELADYTCVYPEVRVQGGRGASVDLRFAESLFVDAGPGPRSKGDRREIDGRHFVGFGDLLHCDGREHSYRPLWWRCGRYAQLTVSTKDQPLRLDVKLAETRYPLEPDTDFTCDDPALMHALPVMLRGLQTCAHETYVDCPYYEQLMYIGDTRLEALTTYALTHDTRLPAKAVGLFDVARLPNGLVQSRFPCRSAQSIPPFSLWWVCMVHDLAMWRGRRDFVGAMLPGVRSVCERFRTHLNADGLLEPLSGWNFVDWSPTWRSGVPPQGHHGVCGPVNWQLVLALQLKAQLEAWCGDERLSERDTHDASVLADALVQQLFSPARRLLADDQARTHFSEHTQALALLTGLLPEEVAETATAALLTPPADLAPATIYFSHYVLEALRLRHHPEELLRRLDLWRNLPSLGFLTTPEAPEPSRSDCHGWGAHPLFHLRASVLGIRPGAFGFERVRIEPQLGPLTQAEGSVPHPAGGMIHVRVERAGRTLSGSVHLPAGVGGSLHVNGQVRQLAGGETAF